MEGPRDYFMKSDRERQISRLSRSLIMWNLIKKDTKELIHKIETDEDFKNKFMVAKGDTWWGEINSEVGTHTHYYI